MAGRHGNGAVMGPEIGARGTYLDQCARHGATLIHVAASRAGACDTDPCTGTASARFWVGTYTIGPKMNQIVYIVGFVVIVLVILGFFGLR